MKAYKVLLTAALMVISASAFAQKGGQPDHGLKFTTVKENPITSIKDQHRSGTCWCFSAISFLESEAIRINNITDESKYPDFSEMFVISLSYQDRAEKFVRTGGYINFAAGSQCEDVMDIMDTYGIVPQSVMPGFNYGTELPVHAEVDAVAKAYVTAVAKKPNKELSTAWKRGFKGIMDAYFGEVPATFTYEGQEYSPKSYRDALHLNKEDYISFTSFTHHPFYTSFPIEVADNWRGDKSYNVPIDEFWEILYNGIMNGYTATWGGDVSEPGFTRGGLALLLDQKVASTAGSDQAKWVGTDSSKKEEKADKKAPKELVVTQESRQNDFDRQTTTDDHGMHAYGIAKDQFGNTYLMIKNSWGKTGLYEGHWYMSKAFCQGKAMGFMIHKDAVPQEIKDKLGIK